MKMMMAKLYLCSVLASFVQGRLITPSELSAACAGEGRRSHGCASLVARAIVVNAKDCFGQHQEQRSDYAACVKDSCSKQCGGTFAECKGACIGHAVALFEKLHSATHQEVADSTEEAEKPLSSMTRSEIEAQAHEAAGEEASAMAELQAAQARMRNLNNKIQARAEQEIRTGDSKKGYQELEKVHQLSSLADQIDQHLDKVAKFKSMANSAPASIPSPSFLQQRSKRNPEDELAKEMTHDLEMNFNKIAPFGKEDTAKELQDHAAKTQDTLVDAVENAEVAEIKRAVFRALTRLRAATIKEFDTIARLETQAIDAYNDAHHYRAENPLAHLHEDEAPVETDKLKSFH